MKYSIKKHNGIGLIEVLITTLVVALGLLAVASLQGNLMSTSGSNKARSEAKSLCENRLEQLRDTATKGVDSSTIAGEYSGVGMVSPAVVTGTAPTRTGVTTESGLTGTNETFARVTTVTELINPTRKQLVVTCTWGNGDDDHKIVVQTVLGFDSLAAAIKVAKPASGAALGNPSTNAGSSTEIHDSTTIELTTPGTAQTTWTGKEDGQYLKVNSDDNTTGSVVYKCTGGTFIAFDVAKGLYTRRVPNPNTNSSFADTIELAQSNNDTLFDSGTVSSCTRKIRYNGGIMLPIRGAVYSKTSSHSSIININLFTFDASESGIYCAFPLDDTGTVITDSTKLANLTKASYVCYAGGNCVNGPVGTHVTTDGITITTASTGNAVVTECPTSIPSPGAYLTVGPGGWRGEVGLLGIPSSNAAHNNVCFAEEVAANPTVLNTARNYFTRRFSSNPTARNEGLNKPYACHDFLIIDGKNTEAAVHNECVDQVGVLKLASKNIMRDFTSATSSTSPPNDVDLTIGKSSCHGITGTVTSGMTTVQATSTTGFFDCTVNTIANTYECYGTAIGVNTGTTNSPVYAASVLLKEGTMVNNAFSAGARSCTTTLTTSNTNLICNIASAAATRNIAVTVNDAGGTTGTTAVTSVLDNSTTPAFTCVQSGSTNVYNCTALTAWTGTIKAISTCNNIAATDTLTTSIAAGTTSATATITLPSCAASTTHNLVVTVNASGLGTTNITGVTDGGITCSIVTSGISGATYTCANVSNTGADTTATAASTCNGGDAINTTSAAIPATDSTATINLASCAAVNYTLTVTAPTNGVIQEIGNLTNINCGATCTHGYTSGSSVFLSAVPNTGYAFSSWGGACSAVTISTCTVNMTAAQAVSAIFKKKITGTITLGSQASNSSLAINAGAVACDVSAGTSYFCLVDTSVNPVISLSVAGCSTPPSGGKKQDITSSVTGTAVQGTGSVSASFTPSSATTTTTGPNFTISKLNSSSCP